MPSPASKRVLICEGLEGAYFPDVTYVVQGEGDNAKVCVFEGAEKLNKHQLHESVGGNFSIVESVDKLELVEREGKKYVKDGRWFVEGVAQRSGVENANKRKYSRKIWERIIANPKSKQQTAIRERGMTGHFEHPADGRTNGPSVALVTVSAHLQEDGTVWAKHELLDTPNGKILQELTAKRVRWGVSSRGTGSIDENGNVNENDYEMECWDGVMRPSTPGAYPKRVGESAEDGQGTPAKKPLDESVRALVAELHEELDKPLEAAVSESSMVAYAAALLKKAEQVMVPQHEEGDAKAIFSKLVTRLQKAEESIVAAAVEESVRLAAEGKPAPRVDMRATARVLEHLRDLTKAAVEEAEENARKLTEAEAEMGRMRQRLAEAEQKNTALKAQIAAATAAISKLTRREVPESTVDPVQEFISEVPGLERFRTVLEAASPDKLQSVVESLLPEVLVESAPVVEEVAGPRRSMPKGDVSGTLPAKKPLSTAPVSETVKTTAAVIARMSIREG